MEAFGDGVGFFLESAVVGGGVKDHPGAGRIGEPGCSGFFMLSESFPAVPCKDGFGGEAFYGKNGIAATLMAQGESEAWPGKEPWHVTELSHAEPFVSDGHKCHPILIGSTL